MADKSSSNANKEEQARVKLSINRWRWGIFLVGLMAIVAFTLMSIGSSHLKKKEAREAGEKIAETKRKVTPVARVPATAVPFNSNTFRVIIPAHGKVVIRVGVGSGLCDPQGRVQVETSAGESFEDGPGLTIRRGKVPTGTREEYRSLTGHPVEMTCFNRSLVL